MEATHKPKGWKQYLLEGLMIFVAVSMGFIAENIREHFADKEIEKRNIESLIRNLESDTTGITRTITFCEEKFKIIDSLAKLTGEFTDFAYQKKFFYYVTNLTGKDSYVPNESAFLQMQSSNTFRLISKQNVADSILTYHQRNVIVSKHQGDMDRIFDMALTDLTQITDLRSLNLRFNGNYQHVQSLINHKIIDQILTDHYNYLLKRQLRRATNLIVLLKEEYGIE